MHLCPVRTIRIYTKWNKKYTLLVIVGTHVKRIVMVVHCENGTLSFRRSSVRILISTLRAFVNRDVS